MKLVENLSPGELSIKQAVSFANAARQQDNKDTATAHAEAVCELLARNGYNPINFGPANEGTGFAVLLENPDYQPEVIDA